MNPYEDRSSRSGLPIQICPLTRPRGSRHRLSTPHSNSIALADVIVFRNVLVSGLSEFAGLRKPASGSSFASPSRQIAGIRGHVCQAVDSSRRPADLDRVDAIALAQAEMEPRVVGRLVAAAALPLRRPGVGPPP